MRQRFQKPDGSEDDFDYLAGKSGITIFALTDDGFIILKEEFKQGTRRLCLESPSAIVRPIESYLDTAKRELQEESGYVPGNLILLSENLVFGERKFNYGYRLALATDCKRQSDPTPDAGEVAFNVYLATAEEFWEAVNGERIRACQTVHAAYAAASIGLISANPVVTLNS